MSGSQTADLSPLLVLLPQRIRKICEVRPREEGLRIGYRRAPPAGTLVAGSHAARSSRDGNGGPSRTNGNSRTGGSVRSMCSPAGSPLFTIHEAFANTQPSRKDLRLSNGWEADCDAAEEFAFLPEKAGHKGAVEPARLGEKLDLVPQSAPAANLLIQGVMGSQGIGHEEMADTTSRGA